MNELQKMYQAQQALLNKDTGATSVNKSAKNLLSPALIGVLIAGVAGLCLYLKSGAGGNATDEDTSKPADDEAQEEREKIKKELSQEEISAAMREAGRRGGQKSRKKKPAEAAPESESESE